jgi:thioredoxin reductase
METLHREYLIVGAGPAGLQTAYFLKQAGRDCLVLESGSSAGTFFKTFPRHRKLISINKVATGTQNPEINLRWDWNSLLSSGYAPSFKDYSQRYLPAADDMVRYLDDFARVHKLPIRYDARVVRIGRKHGRFVLQDHRGSLYGADRLIVATGLSRPVHAEFPGAEFVEPYATVSVDPEAFRNQRVMIIGKGNSGFETAENLIETTATIHLLSPSPVRMAWKTHYVGHLRAVNNNFLDTYQLKSQNTVLDAEIEWVRPKGNTFQVGIRYSHANDERRVIEVERILGCVGFRFDDSIFEEACAPKLTDNRKYPMMTAAWESVDVPCMYFAGTLMHMRDYRRTFSGFIHGFRYNIEALVRNLMKRHHGTPWPRKVLPGAAKDLLEHVVERVHGNSALFQQPGFFCDAAVWTPDSGFLYYEELPVGLLDELSISGLPHFTLTMEYGHQEYPDPFNIERFPDDGERSHFIHPVIRYSSGNGASVEHHVPEDLENDWRKPHFLDPALAFIERTQSTLRPRLVKLEGQSGSAFGPT